MRLHRPACAPPASPILRAAILLLCLPMARAGAKASGSLPAAEPPPPARQRAADPLFPLAPAQSAPPTRSFDLTVLGDSPLSRPLEQGAPEFVPGDAGERPFFRVRVKQAGIRIEEPVFVNPETVLSWEWRKEKGTVCIVQLGLQDPDTGRGRYLGYAAGSLSEPPSADPTIEITLRGDVPTAWAREKRNLLDDVHKVLGWKGARITSFFLSPWDGEAGDFREASLRGVSPVDAVALAAAERVRSLSRAGKGGYSGLPLGLLEDPRVDRFETSFEECAPGRNSGANEWSAFGAIGNVDFNCMGRDLWVRYPAFDLTFRIEDDGREIVPGDLPSFRLGLVGGHLPGVWGGWEHGGLLYKVSVMTVPSRDHGNFDLYKLEVQNLGTTPAPSRLVAAVEGPPDMTLEAGVVRGLGGHPFVVADPPSSSALGLRSHGLCDKRAKAYATAGGPGTTDAAIATYRLGFDGLPVVYRFRAPPAGTCDVFLASTPHISGHLLEKPGAPGDLVFEYRVEGCERKTIDWLEWTRTRNLPLCAAFEGARDADGDGAIEVRSGVSPDSRIRHTRLSAIYVFPTGTRPQSLEAVTSGALNSRCLLRIDVGATPEQGPLNQHYDRSDLPVASLALSYAPEVAPGERLAWWLRVPPIHRRQPVSMGYISHAFREVLPGEAVPSFDEGRLRALVRTDPREAEEEFAAFWDRYLSKAARFDVPDRVLEDIYLSRLATRAILDVSLSPELSYNACSPFFYFDHAWRDHAYVVYAFDLAGLHDEAEKLLRVYCRDSKDVPPGPIAFDGKPLRLGMLESGLWSTRPGQWDTQGQNIWALAEHWKLTGDRRWLQSVAYPYIRRGALWLVGSRHRHMDEVKDPDDPRYGLLEPGAMEVLEVGGGSHLYYLSAFGVLGLREAADAARALGMDADARLFAEECQALKRSLARSFERTFRRTGLYEGHLHFGAEPEGVGMYGFWAQNCLLWPCRAIDPGDPMLTATVRKMEMMSDRWGGGMHSEAQGSFWPYIGVDRAVGSILRGEPDRALDYFCAFTDTAGGTLSWGEGYTGRLAGGDQPHMWADAQWINLFRQLFVFEEGATLWLTPALFRRWHAGDRPVSVSGLPTHFGDLDMTVEPRPDGGRIRYRVRIQPRGDQGERKLERILLFPRIAGGRAIRAVEIDGTAVRSLSRDAVVLPDPRRGEELEIVVEAGD